MSEAEDPRTALNQELRRGIVVLAVLSQLHAQQYGYSLIQQLADKGFDLEEGTLYPLLRRLEKQGLLDSAWDTTEARPRKYYRISPAGREVYAALVGDWRHTANVINSLIS
jgi:DNA-binding PadR family transcriptional regulator